MTTVEDIKILFEIISQPFRCVHNKTRSLTFIELYFRKPLTWCALQKRSSSPGVHAHWSCLPWIIFVRWNFFLLRHLNHNHNAIKIEKHFTTFFFRRRKMKMKVPSLKYYSSFYLSTHCRWCGVFWWRAHEMLWVEYWNRGFQEELWEFLKVTKGGWAWNLNYCKYFYFSCTFLERRPWARS